uniref:Homeobox protein GBX-1 n=1 Tax=Chelydra serpentina TaxID=8475 RepID=A0A8C3SQ45_CHESE
GGGAFPAPRPLAMQRPSGQGAAFSIDSLIGTPAQRSGHLLYTGYPMFMPYRPLVLPHAPLQSGLPPLAPLASFAGRLTNTFCASLGQGVPSMVALTTALPNFSEPPDGFYPAQELPAARTNPEPGCRRSAESLEAEELPPARDKGPPEPPLHFPDPFPSLAGKSPVQASGTFCGVGR